MGAVFNEMSLHETNMKDDVLAAFEVAQDDDYFQNGDDATGSWGMASGLKFHDHMPLFDDSDAARIYLRANCEPLEDAIAVRYQSKSGPVKWMLGAWCAN